MARALKKWKETHNYVSCFSLHFFYALVTSNVLYNRTELSQHFSFLFRKRYEIFDNIEKMLIVFLEEIHG